MSAHKKEDQQQETLTTEELVGELKKIDALDDEIEKARAKALRKLRRFVKTLRGVNPEFPSQQLAILLAIADEPGVAAVELCKRLDIQPGSMTRNTKSLSKYIEIDPKTGQKVTKGLDLIYMTPDIENRKRLGLFLTEAGKEFVMKICDDVI